MQQHFSAEKIKQPDYYLLKNTIMGLDLGGKRPTNREGRLATNPVSASGDLCACVCVIVFK